MIGDYASILYHINCLIFFENNETFNPQDQIIQLCGANHPQISMKLLSGPINAIDVPQQWCGDQTQR
jgi:hypothetical protein